MTGDMQTEDESVSEVNRQPTSVSVNLARGANRLVVGIARHWVALLTIAWAMYVLLPIAAPVLMAAGLTTPAYLIYKLYTLFCHQLPDHSYFLFGSGLTPLAATLEAGGMPSGLNLFQQRLFLGSPELGYKVAICQRDIAIYGSIALAGMLYGLLRNRIHIRPLPFKVFVLLLIPIAVDGLTQLVGLRTSDWFLRSITGILFGVATVWLLYPYVEDAMQDVIQTETARELAEGSG